MVNRLWTSILHRNTRASIGVRRITDGRLVYCDASQFKLANALIEHDPDQEVEDQGGESDSEDWRQEILRNAENHPGPEGTNTREEQLAETERSDPEKSTNGARNQNQTWTKLTAAALPERVCCLKWSVTTIVIDTSQFVDYWSKKLSCSVQSQALIDCP